MPSKPVFFDASKLVSTKTLVLKHDYHRQGSKCIYSRTHGQFLSLLYCDSAALSQQSKQPKCPKVLNEGAKGVFRPLG